MTAVRVTLLSRPGCHLCEAARSVIAKVTAELGVGWIERDITGSPEDTAPPSPVTPKRASRGSGSSS